VPERRRRPCTAPVATSGGPRRHARSAPQRPCVCAEGEARGRLLTLDAEGGIAEVAERAESGAAASTSGAAADAWGRGPHEVCLRLWPLGPCVLPSGGRRRNLRVWRGAACMGGQRAACARSRACPLRDPGSASLLWHSPLLELAADRAQAGSGMDALCSFLLGLRYALCQWFGGAAPSAAYHQPS